MWAIKSPSELSWLELTIARSQLTPLNSVGKKLGGENLWGLIHERSGGVCQRC